MHAPSSELPITLERVTMVAGGVKILDEITLKFSSGAPTVLIGPNGSGKTTLLRLMMGLIEPSSGYVKWSGQVDVPPRRRAIVFQRPSMLRRSAADNIRYALKAAHVPRFERNDRVAELLRLVGLEGLGERPARRLSGGEQQRLALARALARNPVVLFLDEPAASLDPAATKGFEELICAVAERGIKVVMSTHDLGAAKRLAGEIVLLHRGRVIETGPASAFFSEPKMNDTKRFIAGELLL